MSSDSQNLREGEHNNYHTINKPSPAQEAIARHIMKWYGGEGHDMKCSSCGKEIGQYQPYFRVKDDSDDIVICMDCKNKEREKEEGSVRN